MSLRRVVTIHSMLLLAAGHARAAEVPVGFKDQRIADGITSPTAITALPDGRLLVVQQNGVIHTVKDDVMLSDNYWEVPNVDSTYERGCLGIVADPNYESNHYVYAYCSIKGESTSNNHVIRVTEVDGRADPSTETKLIDFPEIRVMFHMGGAMRFGMDGSLYVAVGNHEDGPLDDSNSQKLENPFGKILRLRPDGSFPDDNPFVDRADAYPGIWSYGYRNPFAFDIQPGTGRVLVGDVGQGTWEEIDEDKRGANYGWPIAEGPSDDPRFEPPLYSYKHTDGRCSITGGAFYNPRTAQFPEAFVGKFLFEEFCAGTIEVLDPATATAEPFASGLGYPTNMVVSPDGAVYYLERNQDTMTHDPSVGTLGKISHTGTAAPRISKQPAAQTIVLGEPVTFQVTAQDAQTIKWQRDGVDIPGATESTYTIAQTTAEDDGVRFTAIASNEFGETSSSAALLTVTTNRPPTAAITGSERIEYAPGEMITLTGMGSDPEDGDLAKDAFTWQVDYQHDKHTHPLLGAMSGSDSLTFMVPEFEAEEANTWVRVELFVKDSGGATHSVYRELYPRTQLSSLTPLDPVINGDGPIARDRSSMDARPMSIDGIAFNTGLGVRAPSDVRFHLDGRCSGKFVVAAGLDDAVADRGSVVFQVFVDDNIAYDSGLKRGSDDRENVVIDVAGAKQLRLVVNDGGDGNTDDNADWGAARVMGCDLVAAEPASENEPAAAGDKQSDKPAVNGSMTTPSTAGASSEAKSGDEQPASSASANKSGDKASAGSMGAKSRSDFASASKEDAPDASTQPASETKSGCSVSDVHPTRPSAIAWVVMLTMACCARARRRRRKH